MYERRHEDVAWQRLKDLQREMEYRRAVANGLQGLPIAPWLLAQRIWFLAALATIRPPRRRPVYAVRPIDEVQESVGRGA